MIPDNAAYYHAAYAVAATVYVLYALSLLKRRRDLNRRRVARAGR